MVPSFPLNVQGSQAIVSKVIEKLAAHTQPGHSALLSALYPVIELERGPLVYGPAIRGSIGIALPLALGLITAEVLTKAAGQGAADAEAGALLLAQDPTITTGRYGRWPRRSGCPRHRCSGSGPPGA